AFAASTVARRREARRLRVALVEAPLQFFQPLPGLLEVGAGAFKFRPSLLALRVGPARFGGTVVAPRFIARSLGTVATAIVAAPLRRWRVLAVLAPGRGQRGQRQSAAK